jgi:hypothetical protein
VTAANNRCSKVCLVESRPAAAKQAAAAPPRHARWRLCFDDKGVVLSAKDGHTTSSTRGSGGGGGAAAGTRPCVNSSKIQTANKGNPCPLGKCGALIRYGCGLVVQEGVGNRSLLDGW